MENYNLTPDVYQKAKKYGMKDVRYLIYADLRAAEWSQKNAWMIAFNGTGSNWTKTELEREMNKLESLESVQKRIRDLKGAGTDGQLSPEALAKATSKEKIMNDLVIAQSFQKIGSEEWRKTTAMIADYGKIKQDDIDQQNNTIHYYLPVSYPRTCQDCLIYQRGESFVKQSKKGGE